MKREPGSFLKVSATGLVVFVLGCSSGGAIKHADRTVTPQEIREVVERNHQNIRALLGNGRISVESPEIAQSGSFELALRKPDSVLVKLEGPFGLDIGSALVTREEFQFYNSFNNQLVTGPTNAQNLGRIFRLDLEFDDVLNLFTGGIFMPEDRLDPDDFAVEGEEFVMRYQRKGGSRVYWVDPETMLIVRVQFVDGQGRLVLEQRFSKFTTIDGITVPQYVRVTMYRERRMVSIAYSDLALNVPFQLSFRVPENASHIRWQ